jgi:hypothetical protein
MKNTEEIDNFIRWFVVPVAKLKELPNGDGAFIAMSIGFFLCERYYKKASKLQDSEDSSLDAQFRNRAAKDLGVNPIFFLHFWQVYRNGMQHQATPRTYKVGDITYKWSISGEYHAIPMYFDEGGFRIICIDPWKFCDSMISKILSDPSCLRKSIVYQFGKIRKKKTARTLHKVGFSQKYLN